MASEVIIMEANTVVVDLETTGLYGAFIFQVCAKLLLDPSNPQKAFTGTYYFDCRA